MKVWFWPRIAAGDDTINPNLTSFPAMTFQFPLASTSPSLLGCWLEWCLNTNLIQLNTGWYQLQHQGLWLFCAVLIALGKDAALGIGACWTANLIKALLLTCFVVCWCQMSLLPCLWIRSGSKLSYKSFQETFKCFQLENLYWYTLVING